ncbi:uncharacterized protein LOC116026117 [Ipomoea triloba]|uniref:uncharacterized protein LOC116026117 n=1 Tax=Ipomoea triloba TaxID=35885 RepID=UPI00125E21AD|nr:uncharacterized protein LOC116026117 [Ipomoea triloba]
MSQQQFQPQIYPYNNVPVHPDTSSQSSSSSSSSHSNGSFGTVFLVLAAILVVSVLACIANRFCSRRSNNSDHHDHHAPKNTMKIHGHGPRGDGKLPREWEGKVQSHEGGGDLELGKRIIGSSKVVDEPSTSSFMAHRDNNGGGKGGGARFAVHHMQFKPAIRSSSFERI